MGQGAAAYSKLTKTNDGLSQSQQFWGNKASQKVAQSKRMAYDKAKTKERYDREDYKDFIKGDEKSDDFDYSGTKNWDEVTYVAANNLSESNVAANRDFQEAQERGDKEGMRAARILKAKRMRGFESIKNQSKKYAGEMATFKTAWENKEVSLMDDRAMNAFEAMEDANYRFEQDDKGNMVAIMLVEDPETGRMVEKRVDSGWTDYIRRVNVTGKDGLADQLLKRLGKKTKTSEEGDLIITESEWSENDEAITRAEIKALRSNPKAMADLLFQATGKKKYEKFSDEDNTAVDNWLYDVVQQGRNTVSSTKTNWAKKNYGLAQQKLAADKAKDEKATSKKESDKIPGVATLVKTPSGDVEVTKTKIGGSSTYKTDLFSTEADAPKYSNKVGFSLKRKDGKPALGIVEGRNLISFKIDDAGKFLGTSVEVVTVKEGVASKGQSKSVKTVKKTTEELNNTQITKLSEFLGYANSKEAFKDLTRESKGLNKTAPKVHKEQIGLFNED